MMVVSYETESSRLHVRASDTWSMGRGPWNICSQSSLGSLDSSEGSYFGKAVGSDGGTLNAFVSLQSP